MADSATPAGQGGGQPAVAQPASQTAAPARSNGVSNRGGVSQESVSRILGGTGINSRDIVDEFEQAPEVTEQSASTPEPVETGHTDGAEATEVPTANEGAEFDGENSEAITNQATEDEPEIPADVLAEFDALTFPEEGTNGVNGEADPSQATNQAEGAAPDFEKITNPTGKATEAERIKNAQSFIGKQSNEIGQLKQEVSKRDQALQKLAGVFEYDPKTGAAKATPKAVLDIADMVEPAELNKALAAKGVKLVPIDYETQIDPLKAREKDITDILNGMIAGDDLTRDEKWAEVENDPSKRLAFYDQLAERKATRLAQQNEKTRQQREQEGREALRSEHAKEQMKQKVAGFFENAKKLPYYDKLKPAMLKVNRMLPPEIHGDLRLDLMFKLGRSSLFKTVDAPTIWKQAFAAAKAKYVGNNRLGGAMPSGEKPIHVPGGNGNGADPDAEGVRRGILASVGLR